MAHVPATDGPVMAGVSGWASILKLCSCIALSGFGTLYEVPNAGAHSKEASKAGYTGVDILEKCWHCLIIFC